jgi:predicted Zn-dependent protease
MRASERGGALELLERAYQLEPESYMASVSLAELQIELARFEEARTVLERLVEREPQRYWPRHFLCIANLRLGLTQEARAGLEGLRAGFPQDPRLADLEAMMAR